MGIVGVVIAIAIVLATLQYDRLPFLHSGVGYGAEFADAGGLMTGDPVEVAGVKVGGVDTIKLEGPQVLVTFTMSNGIQLGQDTRAAIKTNTVLGRKSLSVTPEGPGALTPGDTIPLDRTTSPYSLNDALGDLSNTVKDLNTDQLNRALNTMSDALTNTPAPLRAALDGVARLSKSLNDRDESLRQLLDKAQSVTKVLADRGGQINALLLDGNDLLGELDRRRAAISQLITNISYISQQLTGLVHDNSQQLGPTLDELNRVVAVLQRNKDNIGKALDGLGPYATALGEAVGSGPYFQAFVQNFGSSKYFQGLVDALIDPQHLPPDLQNIFLNPPPSIEFKDHQR
ncbi:MCE family protein [Skermania sp. ID1734]|uniref:MCE family protein n=1 Tax=Skermania sp. ID1734 TaxID=2597516 RepID=UPI0011806BE0|nr:MCE family protein [Skermania sp. ID1734]